MCNVVRKVMQGKLVIEKNAFDWKLSVSLGSCRNHHQLNIKVLKVTKIMYCIKSP